MKEVPGERRWEGEGGVGGARGGERRGEGGGQRKGRGNKFSLLFEHAAERDG